MLRVDWMRAYVTVACPGMHHLTHTYHYSTLCILLLCMYVYFGLHYIRSHDHTFRQYIYDVTVHHTVETCFNHPIILYFLLASSYNRIIIYMMETTLNDLFGYNYNTFEPYHINFSPDV